MIRAIGTTLTVVAAALLMGLAIRVMLAPWGTAHGGAWGWWMVVPGLLFWGLFMALAVVLAEALTGPGSER